MSVRNLLLVALFATGLSGCPRSQPITVEFPANADWEFEYFDASGEQLGFGRAVVGVDADGHGFTMNITENAFGDRAVIHGMIHDEATEAGIPFTARGNWFMGEPYRFSGNMRTDLTGMNGCALAYPEDMDVERLTIDLTIDPTHCRATPPEGGSDVIVEELFFWRVRAPAEKPDGHPTGKRTNHEVSI